MRKLILIAAMLLAGCAVQPSQPIVTPQAPVQVDPTPSMDNPVTRVCDVSYLRDGKVAKPSQSKNAVVTDMGYAFRIHFMDTGRDFTSPMLVPAPQAKGLRAAIDADHVQWMRSPQGNYMVYGFQMKMDGQLLTIGAVC